MSRTPFVVRLPGRRNETLAIDNVRPHETGMQKRTPEWMVSFSEVSEALLGGTMLMKLGLGKRALGSWLDKIQAFSTVHNLTSFTEVFGWSAELQRYVDGDVSGTLLTSGSIKQSPLVLMIPASSFAANAEEVMVRGKVIHGITLLRLGWIRGELKIMQAIVFNHCRLIRFQQQLSRLILHWTVLRKTTMLTVFDQTGSVSGFSVSSTSVNRDTILKI